MEQNISFKVSGDKKHIVFSQVLECSVRFFERSRKSNGAMNSEVFGMVTHFSMNNI